MTPNPSRREALTPVTFHVLLALSGGPLHGYAIMRRVEEESGSFSGPGTIYGALGRLGAQGWVEDAGEDASDARRGRLYRLTRAGREALRDEALRIRRLADLAEERRLLPREGS